MPLASAIPISPTPQVILLDPLTTVSIPGERPMRLIYPPEARGRFYIRVVGERLAAVNFIIRQGDRIVHEQRETEQPFCAFGHAGEDCVLLEVRQGAVWPSSGVAMTTDTYRIEVTVFGSPGGQWRYEREFRVIMPGIS